MKKFTLSPWCVSLFAILPFWLASVRAGVVAEWDFRADENLTVAGGAASTGVTLIHSGTVNLGPATCVGDKRIAEGWLDCGRVTINGSAHHGLQTVSTWSQFFGTASLGEGTLVMVVRHQGNDQTGRKTLFSHGVAIASAEAWLFYDSANDNKLRFRVNGGTSSLKDAQISMTFDPNKWYVIIGTWKAGEPTQLCAREIGGTFSGTNTASVATNGTAYNLNLPLNVGVRENGTEGSDMAIAFVQLSNAKNTDFDAIYSSLTDEKADPKPAGPGVTYRAEFTNSFTADVGTGTLATPYPTATDNTVLGPGLFYEGETTLNCGAIIGARPKQRIFCGSQGSMAPNFERAGTLSFYWSPSFSGSAGTLSGTAFLWGTHSSDDTGFFSGRWEDGKLRAYFGDNIYNEVDMPVEANRWYLIAVSWGPFSIGTLETGPTIRGRVCWEEVKPDSEIQYYVRNVNTGSNVKVPLTVAANSGGRHLKWGDSELCIGSRIGDDTVTSGCRGAIDHVIYQDNIFNLAGAVDGLYENTFPKIVANPFTTYVSGTTSYKAQEVQFPSYDVTLRGYPYNAEWRKNHVMVNYGTTTPVAGFREIADPLRCDYAIKIAGNGTATGLGINNASSVLPNALKTGATIRLLYRPSGTIPANSRATLSCSGTNGGPGYILYRTGQNKLTLEVNTGVATGIATGTISGTDNQFTNPAAWYYVGATWQPVSSGTGSMRVYVRKMDTGETNPSWAANTGGGNITGFLSGTGVLTDTIRLGSRPEQDDPNSTENAQGVIDEVLFVDTSGTTFSTAQFNGDYAKLRRAYSYYDYKPTPASERVRYIPVEKTLRASIELSNDVVPPQLSSYGYSIPMELRDKLNYGPATYWAKKYYEDCIITNTATTGLIRSTSSTALASDAWWVYQALKWSGTADTYNWSGSAQAILSKMQEKFVFTSGTKAWCYSSLHVADGMPVTEEEDSDPKTTGTAALTPQSVVYSRFSCGMMGAGRLLNIKNNTNDQTFIQLGEKIMQTYYDARYNVNIPIVPSYLPVGTVKSDVNYEGTDSLYLTVGAYWVWKESQNSVLQNILSQMSTGWSTTAWVEEWGHPRSKAELGDDNDPQPSQAAATPRLYGDGKINQLRAMSIGYATNTDANVKNELLRKTKKNIGFFRKCSRFGLYPANVSGGNSILEVIDDYDPSIWDRVAQEMPDDDTDNNNICRYGAAFLRDILYGYDATNCGALAAWGNDLAEATVDAGRYYYRYGDTIQRFPNLSAIRGVCRVEVTGLGDTLQITKTIPNLPLVNKPTYDFAKAVVYLKPGTYTFKATRAGQADHVVPVVLTGSATVPMGW